jgi:hypothetical protein
MDPRRAVWRVGMRIETREDLAAALMRLERRSPESLAMFIASLAQDVGPIGEQVRTFIVGDDLVETIASLEERVDALRGPEFREDRDRVGEEVGKRLGYILDAIETLVLPADPRGAFNLMVLLVQGDGDAMECCGDHHDAVASAFERVAGLVEQVARTLPADEVLETLQQLTARDDYGTRRPLAAVVKGIATAGSEG